MSLGTRRVRTRPTPINRSPSNHPRDWLPTRPLPRPRWGLQERCTWLLLDKRQVFSCRNGFDGQWHLRSLCRQVGARGERRPLVGLLPRTLIIVTALPRVFGGHVGQDDPLVRQLKSVPIACNSSSAIRRVEGPRVPHPDGAAGLRHRPKGGRPHLHSLAVCHQRGDGNNRIRIPSRKILQQQVSAAARSVLPESSCTAGT